MMKSILITGGTGSFGRALVERIFWELQESYPKIIIFSRDEKKQFDMKLEFKNSPELKFVIGDVRDVEKLRRTIINNSIDTIFHAAALKHISVGEVDPEEAIKTNVLGIINVLHAAEDSDRVLRVVNLSSDKATYPVNAYGMTKGLSEKVVAAHRGYARGVNLRYGNVLGSRGSVIPLFLDQIRNNQVLTVTNYNMTRFLLPLKTAVFLALKCEEEGNPGDLFVIKSPSCTIQTLIHVLELHFDRRFPVKEIGIRAGEKMHETLLTEEEVSRAVLKTSDGIEYWVVPKAGDSIKDYSECSSFTSGNTEIYNAEQTLDLLREVGILDNSIKV